MNGSYFCSGEGLWQKHRSQAANLCWCLLFGLGSLSSGPAEAHDMWIVPPEAPVPLGEVAMVPLEVGHGGEANRVRRNPDRIVRFHTVGPSSEVPVVGVAGADPAGIFRPDVPGTWIVGFESTPVLSELGGEKFEKYLEEEGLGKIARLRREQGENNHTGRESYSRSLKSLFPVGEAAKISDRRIGLPLELVLESSLKGKRAAGTAVLRLYWQGEPLTDALVDVRRLDQKSEYAAARTGRDGRVAFELGPGGWVFAVVHMEPVAESGADWRSYFATSTFSIE